MKGPIGDEAVRLLAAEMVLILEYLHTNGIAHRDFKVIQMILSILTSLYCSLKILCSLKKGT